MPNINAFSVSQFKAFGEDPGKIEIKPITLIFGPNSAGKSSLLHALLVAHDLILTGKSDIRHPTLSGSSIDVGGFKNYVHNHDETATVTFEFSYQLALDDAQSHMEHDVSCYCTLSVNAGNVHRLSLYVEEQSESVWETPIRVHLLSLIRDEHNEKQLKIVDYNIDNQWWNSRTAYSPQDSITLRDARWSGDGWDIQLVYAPETSSLCHTVVMRCVEKGIASIVSFAKNLDYIEPLRIMPDRLISTRETPHHSMRMWFELLNHSATREEVNMWLKSAYEEQQKNNIHSSRYEFVRRDYSADHRYRFSELVLRAMKKKKGDEADEGIDISLRDVGVGLSQMLPIVIASKSRNENVILIEQPETHIHPRLQTEVADLMIAGFKSHGNRFVVETHSEHLILRIQRRIREQQLSADDVAVYYVQSDTSNVHVQRLELSYEGEFLNDWPNGYFDERINELF